MNDAPPDETPPRWWGAFCLLLIELKGTVVYDRFPNEPYRIALDLPDDWTEERFLAEVDRRVKATTR